MSGLINKILRLAVYTLITCTGACAQSLASIESKEAAIEQAQAVSNSFLGSLKSELVKAMAEGGPKNAIDVCSRKAMPLTESSAKSASYVAGLKRTSMRVRNLSNAPDERELKVLNHFASLAASNEEMPQYYLQVEKENFHFYKPIIVDAPCLSCHGTKASLAPDVLAELAKRYPEDQALGYSLGDFRGLLHVTLRRGN